jgi:hypothetical protein
VKSLIAVLCLLSSSIALAQEPELTLGGPVTLERIPERMLRGPDLSSHSALLAAQNAAGDLTLDGATFTLSKPGEGARPVLLVVRKLELKNSTLITNGNHLVIYAHEIVGNNASRITAFDESATTAMDRPSGAAGAAAGKVELFLTGRVAGPLFVDLSGQDGQHGVDGRPGAAGAEGPRGRNAKARWGVCRSGQGRGGNGENGGAGGRGGDAGAGGNGGLLTVTFYNTPVEVAELRYTLDGGDAGTPGKGGVGGPGGRGGPPGKNTSPCKQLDALFGLPPGHGSNGQSGANGENGKSAAAGSKGQFTASRVELPK